MKRRVLWLIGFCSLASGCAAMMMGGDGGYKPPADCTTEQQKAGLCKSP
jgi:hypothetical protein